MWKWGHYNLTKTCHCVETYWQMPLPKIRPKALNLFASLPLLALPTVAPLITSWRLARFAKKMAFGFILTQLTQEVRLFVRNTGWFHLKEISWNQFTIWFMSDKVVFTKFHRNICETLHEEKWEILSHRKNISWNQLFSNFYSKTAVAFTKFLSIKCKIEFP